MRELSGNFSSSRALQTVVRPVVRFCLRHSFRIQDLLEAVKVVFVEESKKELIQQGESPNISRVAVMSGLRRREVKALMLTPERETNTGNILTKIVGQWGSDSRFSLPNGRPRVLSVEGRESEFGALVRSVTNDLNPYTILSELERVQAVERTPTGIKLNVRAVSAKGNPKEALGIYSRDSDDLLRAIEENVESSAIPGNHHIRTEYDCIPVEIIPTLREWLLVQGRALHELAREHLAKFDLDITGDTSKKPKVGRVVLGSFSFTEEMEK